MKIWKIIFYFRAEYKELQSAAATHADQVSQIEHTLRSGFDELSGFLASVKSGQAKITSFRKKSMAAEKPLPVKLPHITWYKLYMYIKYIYSDMTVSAFCEKIF